jgi:hypothetical protein
MSEEGEKFSREDVVIITKAELCLINVMYLLKFDAFEEEKKYVKNKMQSR